MRELFPEKNSGKANARKGNAKADISTLKPNAEIIQAVTVVPILAPIMTPIACVKLKRPAFTKLTTMTVVADEDWIRAVISMPVKTPATRFEVMAVRIRRKLSPASFCKPSLMIFMPYKKSPNAPSRRSKSKKE